MINILDTHWEWIKHHLIVKN